MLRSDPRVVWRPLRTAGYVALLALIALTLAVEGSQPGHTHQATTAGVFNGDCSLAALAAFHGASPLPESPPSTWVALADALPFVARSEQPPASPAQHTDSRAPPAPLA